VADETFLEGWVSIRAALISGSRDVVEILLQKDKVNPNLSALIKRAREKRVPVKQVSSSEMAKLVEGQTHGGAVARVGPRKFVSLETLGIGPSAAFVAMLEGVEDPYNFGQALRALHAAGAHGLVLRPRNWLSAASTVARASAGASEFMAMAVAETTEDAIRHFKARGFTIACTGLNGMPHFQADLRQPIFMIIGGEKRGISASVLKQADMVLTIPYGRDFRQALDTTSATAALAFEVLRQRKFS
jgi:23S rRNA (guanosine2251-2'-O)-methyltransferase